MIIHITALAKKTTYLLFRICNLKTIISDGLKPIANDKKSGTVLTVTIILLFERLSFFNENLYLCVVFSDK
ncbi:MAG: hypothetical protein DRP35_09200 [Candidatus Zixiibacteriota bacterium]|nr:MAG: hypothetical protein DRP35_09200 [candidate division Zixibacteria bacterium]